MAVVRIMTGGREFRREIGNRLVIGRDMECDVQVDDRKISRLHCLIERKGEEYVAVDLDSHNGTMISGWPLTRQTLKHGDVLDMGVASLQFLIEAADQTANEAVALAREPQDAKKDVQKEPVTPTPTTNPTPPPYVAPARRQTSLWEHAMRASDRTTKTKSRKRKRVKPEVLRKQLLASKAQTGVAETVRVVHPAYASPWYHRTIPLKLGIPASLALIALLYVLTNGAPSINFGSANHSQIPKSLSRSSPNNND